MHLVAILIASLLFNGSNKAQLAEGHPVMNNNTANYETKSASDFDYSFIVSIGKKGNRFGVFTQRQGHFCGGSLVTRRHVLTAAHCLDGKRPKDLRVVVGTADFKIPGVEYQVSGWKIYNEWPGRLDSGTDHDIAVVQLSSVVVESNVDTIDVYPRHIDTNGLQLETAGWGKTEKYNTSPILLIISLKLVSLTICEFNLTMETGKPQYVTIQHMCTRSDHQMRLDEGDSGGPLIYREKDVPYVVGVNEAYSKDSTSFLNTHARISYYKKFINEATKQRRSCTSGSRK